MGYAIAINSPPWSNLWARPTPTPRSRDQSRDAGNVGMPAFARGGLGENRVDTETPLCRHHPSSISTSRRPRSVVGTRPSIDPGRASVAVAGPPPVALGIMA